MRNTKPLHKRVLAVLLCLMLLCGTVAGTMNWSAFATASELQKFSVDFQTLTDLVTENGKNFTDGYYSSQATDTFINEWVAERFDLYFNYQLKSGTSLHPDKTKFTKRAYLGQKATELTNTSGNSWWDISDAGRLAVGTAGNSAGDAKNSGHGGNYLSGGNALTLRHNGDAVELRNFETEIVFNTSAEYTAGAVYVSFHEDVPGRFSWQANYTDTSVLQNDAVIVAATADIRAETAYTYCEGVVVRKSGNAIENNWGGTIPEADRFYKDGVAYSLGQNKDYKLYVKVLNGTATIKMTSVDGTVTYYSGEKEVSDGYGTISVGVTGRCRHLETIHVTELDASGNTVDLGTLKAEKDADMYELSVDFADLAQIVTRNYSFTDGAYQSAQGDTAINEWVNARFGLYYNRESHTFAEKTYLGETHNVSGGNNSYWQITQNGYLRAGLSNSQYGEYLRTSEALYLKENGEAVKLDNFTTSVVFNMDDTLTTSGQVGAVYVSFNGITPGKFSWMGNHNSRQGSKYVDDSANLQDAIIIAKEHNTGNIGLIMKSGGETLDIFNGDNTPYTPFDAALALTPHVDYTLDVRVVDSNVTVSVKETTSGTVLLEETTYEGAVTGDEGYVAFGVAQAGAGIKSIAVTELEDTAQDTAVDTFAVDFQALTDIVTNAGKAYTASGYYVVQENDKAINDWVTERFELHFNYQLRVGTTDYDDRTVFTTRPYLGLISKGNFNTDTVGGGRWDISNNGKVAVGARSTTTGGRVTDYDNPGYGGGYLSAAEAMTLRYNGENVKLQNFEAEVVFNSSAEYKAGGVYISFHEASPGKFGWKANGTDTTMLQNDAVIVATTADITTNTTYTSCEGIVVRKYGDPINNNWGDPNSNTIPAADRFYKDGVAYSLGQNKDYKLYVKVLNGTATIKVTSVDDTVTYYSGSKTVSDTVGTISVGNLGRGRPIETINVTELDENGNAVDYGTLSEKEKATSTSMTVDFADLSKIVTQNYTFTDGVYKSGANDTAINTWVNERFGLYYNREVHTFAERQYLGQNSNEINNDRYTGPHYFLINENGWLTHNTEWNLGDSMFRKGAAMWLKYNGEAAQLKNFEASLVFSAGNSDNAQGSVYIAFHGATPGKFSWAKNEDDDSAIKQDAVIVGFDKNQKHGVTVKKYGKETSNNTLGAHFSSNLTFGAWYTLTVRVVGTDVDVLVKAENGTQVYKATYTDAVSDNAGSVYIGTANSPFSFKSLSVTELDENGNAVAFGTMTNKLSDEGRFAVDFSDLATVVSENYSFTGGAYKSCVNDAAINAWVNERFALYFNRECWSHKQKNYLGEENATGGDVSYLSIAENGYLRAGMANSAGGETLRTAETLTVKHDGDAIKLNNFETSVVFNVDDTITTAHQPTAVYVAFNQTVAGKFGWKVNPRDEADTYFVQPDAIIISKEYYTQNGTAGLTVKSGGETIHVNPNDVTFDQTFTLAADTDYTLYVKVVDKDVTVSLTETASGRAIVAQTTYAGAVTGDMGYVSFGLAQAGAGFKSIRLTQLDEDGKRVEFGTAVTPGIDEENTVLYKFNDENGLDDFESYFMPETNSKGVPAIYTEGTADDNMLLRNGTLAYQANSLCKTTAEYNAGVEINGVTYQDPSSWRTSFANNVGIAVLKTEKYKNFILDVDYTTGGYWPIVGFGAQGTSADDVFWTQKNGGYIVRAEYSSGKAEIKFSGYNPSVETSVDFSSVFVEPYTSSGTHHMRLVVSDGMVYVYLDDIEEMVSWEIPDTYAGGYIYLAANNTAVTFDNLQIMDLDKKDIEITRVDMEQTSVTIDRSAGDILSLPASVTGYDADGRAYDIQVSWNNDDYYSYKEGTYTFTMQSEMSAFKLSDSVPTMQVINQINDDFDSETSIKYYFDYDNELNDFLCYYSQKNYGGITGKWSADDAVLVKGDPLTMWKTANGKVSTAYIGEAGGHSWRNMGKSISTMLLKDYQLKNYRLEIEYTHAPHSIWYAYVLNCVQDPGQFFASYYSANPEDYATGNNLVKSYNDVAAGLYTYLEREGRINVYGANSIVDTEERLVYSSPLSEEDDFFDTYDYSVPHKMTITVVDGIMSIQVDDCIPYRVELEDAALGGYVGFAGMGNGETFSNLVLTALDEDGNVIPLDEAEQGFGDGDVPSIHEAFVGWKPSSDAWEFSWNKNYIFSY